MTMANTNSEYVLDKMVESLSAHGDAREELEDVSSEELIDLVYSLRDDLLELKHDEFVVYNAARDVLYDRGYTYAPTPGFTILDPEGKEV